MWCLSRPSFRASLRRSRSSCWYTPWNLRMTSASSLKTAVSSSTSSPRVPRRRLLRALTCSAPDMRSTLVVQPQVSHMIRPAPGLRTVGNGSMFRAFALGYDLWSHARLSRVEGLALFWRGAPAAMCRRGIWRASARVLAATVCDARTDTSPVEPEAPGERREIRAVHLAAHPTESPLV